MRAPSWDRKYSVLTHAPVRVYFFFIAAEMPAAQDKTFPFYACAHYTFNPNKKSLATDAIYCCSLFKHLTLFAGRTTRKHCSRNLCQREQFESKSLRAQYVSHLFIQRRPPPEHRAAPTFRTQALLYGQLCLQPVGCASKFILFLFYSF